MTDNEIIKALECCKTPKCSNCAVCPMRGIGTDCLGEVISNTLDLINHQKAEIERLTAMVEAAEEHFTPLPFKNAFDEYIEKCKAEAIKEFSERLKKEANGYDFCGDGIIYKMVDVEDIDCLAKEMVGE